MPPYHWWRTVFFLIPAIGVYTIVLGTLSLAVVVCSIRRGDFGHRCARAWAWLILKTTGVRVEVRGLEHIERAAHAMSSPRTTRASTTSRSCSRRCRCSCGSSPRRRSDRFPFLGWHLQRTGHLLVDRKNPGAGVLKKMARLVGGARSLIVFPKGTRSQDGTVGRFKGGTFLLAIDNDLPIVPVSIARSRFVMLKGRLMTCPGDVVLTVHAPIATAGVSREQARELAERVRAIVRQDVDEPAAAGYGMGTRTRTRGVHR